MAARVDEAENLGEHEVVALVASKRAPPDGGVHAPDLAQVPTVPQGPEIPKLHNVPKAPNVPKGPKSSKASQKLFACFKDNC